MNSLLLRIKTIDCEKWAVLSLLVLWAGTTFSLALMGISVVVALVFWAGSLLMPGSREGYPAGGRALPRVDWLLWGPLVIFFVLVLASFFTSEYPKESFRGVFKVARPLLAFIMAADLFRTERAQRRFSLCFVLTFLLVIFDSSVQYAFGKDLLRGFAAEPSSAGLRLVGPFGNFAKMSSYLVLVIPVFAMNFQKDFASSGRRGGSFYDLGLALAGFVLLYLTRCRGPVVALVISFLVLFLYKRWFKALGVMLVLFLALVAVTPRGMIIHLDSRQKEQSIVERFELWKRALDVIEAKPWTGTGINTYNSAHDKYDKERNWRVRGYYAHNGYLQLAAEVGLPGLFFFLLFLFMFFRKALGSLGAVRGSSEEYVRLGLLTGLLAFLIYAVADNNLQSPPSLMFFWFLAGVLLARQQMPPSGSQSPQ